MAFNRLQPIYKLMLEVKKEWYDITQDIVGDVTYSEEGNYVNKITCTLRAGLFEYVDLIVAPGFKIKFWGGGFSGSDKRVESDNYTLFMKGTIQRFNIQFTKDGTDNMIIEAYDTAWGAAVEKTHSMTYPSKNCARAWGRKSPIKVSEVVTNLIKEIGKVGIIDFPKEYDKDLAYIASPKDKWLHPIEQKDQTDLAFLRMVGETCGAVLGFRLNEQGEEVIDFIAEDNLPEATGLVKGFRYAIRKPNKGQAEMLDFEPAELEKYFIQLDEVSIDVNTSAITALERRVTNYTEEGNDTSFYIQFYDAKLNCIRPVLVKLDPKKVENNMALIESRSLQTFNEQELVERFFIILEENNDIAKDSWFAGVGGRLGINITASCEGNVNIRARRKYLIEGIRRFSSTKLSPSNTQGGKRTVKYLIQTVNHVWGSKGYRCENITFVY